MASQRTGAACLTLIFALFALLAAFCVDTSKSSWSLVCLGVITVLLWLWLWGLRRRDGDTERRVCVLVLGDIGRSPRMQYHALSLSKHGFNVTFVGFLGERDTFRLSAIHYLLEN